MVPLRAVVEVPARGGGGEAVGVLGAIAVGCEGGAVGKSEAEAGEGGEEGEQGDPQQRVEGEALRGRVEGGEEGGDCWWLLRPDSVLSGCSFGMS